MDRKEIQAMRRSYSERDYVLPDQPIEAFKVWLREAADLPSIIEPNAMVLSTEGIDGITSRSVLLKDVSDDGFTFFTNYNSRKAKAIEINSQVSLLFPWYAMERQVIILGNATKVTREESEEYFQTRPYGSQIGAWASHQSMPMSSREELQVRFDGAKEKWPTEVPTPPHWGGYLVKPYSIEFWQGRPSRLHERTRFELDDDGNWVKHLYYP